MGVTIARKFHTQSACVCAWHAPLAPHRVTHRPRSPTVRRRWRSPIPASMRDPQVLRKRRADDAPPSSHTPPEGRIPDFVASDARDTGPTSAPIPNPAPAPEDVPSGTETPPSKPRGFTVRKPAMPLPTSSKSPEQGISANKRAPSLVLPSFDDTFSRPPRVWPPRASVWERALGAVNAYLFPKMSHQRAKVIKSPPKQSQKGSTAPHLHAEHEQAMPRAYHVLGNASSPHARGYARIKTVVVLGVHGWYAQSIFKNVLGAPVGTSMRFATMMAESVRERFREAGHPLAPEALTVIAPQYDGKVEDRTRRFFTEITENPAFVAALRHADALLIPAHSQGAIVATLLLDQLLRKGFVDPQHTRICILSMCGIYQGPFVSLRSSLASSYINYFETSAARELFDFQTSDTPVSRKHHDAYARNLAAGVKLVHVGSIDDNVVPLYSALYSSAAHPSVLRAVYIDGVAFPQTDFLIGLIILCVAVRNCGFHDHNILTLLSASVAGSLYGGLGHSLIYDEPAVYDLATRYLFETSSPKHSGASHIPLTMTPFAAQRWNPYELPWALRGLLDDDTIQHFFDQDMITVVKDFAVWRPTSKPLKDLQWRLSSIRTIPLPLSEEAREAHVPVPSTRSDSPHRIKSKL